ncbi:hypothetical protein C8Q77DRAFT_805859 [Trametes polyzona]|nr:hypothetical protein C8Q77DRAFT_805859 [Trametes polyzona]
MGLARGLTISGGRYNPRSSAQFPSAICSSLLPSTSSRRNIHSSTSLTAMAPTACETSPTSDNSLLLPPVFQVTVLFSIVSLVLRYLGSRVSFTGISQPQASLPVDVELQADAPGSVYVRRSRFRWFSALFRRFRDTSHEAWLDFTATLMILGRGTSVEFLPLPASSPRSSSFSVSLFIRMLLGRTRRLMDRIPSLAVVGVETVQPELSYQAAWAPYGVVLSVVQANSKFAPTKNHHQTSPCRQLSIPLPPPTISFNYTFPCDPSGITPSGVG